MTAAYISRRVVFPDGVRPAAVLVDKKSGLITRVADADSFGPVAELYDLGEQALLPGLIDPHVHINEPGRTHWEGFETATRAAAAGGITTVIDMPLNCLPPTTTVAGLAAKRAAAAGTPALRLQGRGARGHDRSHRPKLRPLLCPLRSPG